MRIPKALIVLLALGGCQKAPLSYLDATGPISGPIALLGQGLTAISVAVCVIVAILLAFALWRGQRAPDLAIRPVKDRTPLRWIGFGVALSTVVLLGSAVWTLMTVRAIGQSDVPGTLTLDVTGQEWWWSMRYHGNSPVEDFTTANQIVIPVGIPVKLRVSAADVIHSFWVPKLNGKMDMIPSRVNVTWLKADQPGTFRGQCTEFCGLEHAWMAFDVQVLSQSDFQAWRDHQLAPAHIAQGDPGLAVFMEHCAACHAIRGTTAGGILGPDLSHFAERKTIAAGLLPNTADNLADWINNTQTLKPGVKMPELHLANQETQQVAAFLEALQ